MKPYKQLRKKLNKNYTQLFDSSGGYPVMGAVRQWLIESGIKPKQAHIIILQRINGGTVYPYQKADRKRIRKYLKENKKWNP